MRIIGRFLVLLTLSVCCIVIPILAGATEDQYSVPPMPEAFKHIKPAASGNISPESKALTGDRTGTYVRPNTSDKVRNVRLIVYVTSDTTAVVMHGVGTLIDLTGKDRPGWFLADGSISVDNQGRKHLKFVSDSGNKFDFFLGPDGRLWGDSHNRHGEHKGTIKMQ